jgi:hypothetical protein
MKPRKPLPRPTKPIARYVEPKRSSKPIPQRRKGKPRRRAGACRPYLDWLKTQACRVTGHFQGDWYWERMGAGKRFVMIWVDPAHVKTRGSGGSDLHNALSLSRAKHEEQHHIGIPAFEAKYGVSMKALAIAQTEEWLATPEGLAWLDVQQEGTA